MFSQLSKLFLGVIASLSSSGLLAQTAAPVSFDIYAPVPTGALLPVYSQGIYNNTFYSSCSGIPGAPFKDGVSIIQKGPINFSSRLSSTTPSDVINIFNPTLQWSLTSLTLPQGASTGVCFGPASATSIHNTPFSNFSGVNFTLDYQGTVSFSFKLTNPSVLNSSLVCYQNAQYRYSGCFIDEMAGGDMLHCMYLKTIASC